MMALGHSINEASEGKNQQYLDIMKLKEFEEISTIAYVHDVSIGRTKAETGFVKLYLKDCNSKVITATLFDVEDFTMSGVNVTQFKHRPVRLLCIVQEFRGQLSLIIDGKNGIQLYDGEFDYDQFIGRLDSNLESLEKDLNVIGCKYTVDTDAWRNSLLDNLAGGSYGAYARLVEYAYDTVSGYVKYMSVAEREDVLKSFAITAEYYYRYLQKQQKLSVVGTVAVYPFIQEIMQITDGDDSKTVILDVFGAVVGLSEPKHLYAHLIKNAFDTANTTIRLQSRYKSMVVGTTTRIGGAELSKY